MSLCHNQRGAIAAFALLAITLGSAHADITLREQTTVDIPIKHGEDPQVHRAASKSIESQIYVSGHKCRFETPLLIVITDRDASKTWLLNPANHMYATSPYNRKAIAGIQSGVSNVAGLGHIDIETKVKDTGRTTNIMGHTAHHYIIKTYVKVLNRTSTVTSDVLAALDLSETDLDAWSEANINSYGPNVRGVPLITEMKEVGGTSNGNVTRIIATSISTDPIPSSTFAIPSGYTETSATTLFAPSPK